MIAKILNKNAHRREIAENNDNPISRTRNIPKWKLEQLSKYIYISKFQLRYQNEIKSK